MQDEKGGFSRTDDAWERAILSDPRVRLSRHAGAWFLYRPGQVVVDPAVASTDEGRKAHGLLEQAGAKPVPVDDRAVREPRAPRTLHDDALAARRLGLELYSVPDTHREREPDHVPNLVRRMRREAADVATLNHVQVADPHRVGGTGPAIVADRPTDIPGADGAAGKGIRIAVIDTGLDPSLQLAPVQPADYEIADDAPVDKILDPAAGHGTFITGILRRIVPGAEITVHRALVGPAGLAGDLEVAEAILAAPAGVDLINCSFGGTSIDDAPPIVIARALSQLDPRTVVVSSAGNEDENRPHWPGAFKGVYAVASVERHEGGDWAAADYSNYGWWVDACAPGSQVHSTFLKFTEQGGALRDFDYGAIWSGTSFAAPQVVALIARLASSDGISASEAAYRLIDDPTLPRLSGLGTLIVP